MTLLHMHKPIWVWVYLKLEVDEARDRPPLAVWPQAHTYAFDSEAEAVAHPDKVGWHKQHGYTLQKVWLQVPMP